MSSVAISIMIGASTGCGEYCSNGGNEKRTIPDITHMIGRDNGILFKINGSQATIMINIPIPSNRGRYDSTTS